MKKEEEFEIKLIVKTIATGSGGIYSSVSQSKRVGDITHGNYAGKREIIQISVNKYEASLDKDLIN